MSKYIKGFNAPYLKYQAGNVTRVINIDEVVEVEYWGGDSAYIYFKSGLNHEINYEAAREIDEFLMNYKVVNITLPGGIQMDTEMVHDEQTLLEWLQENGQA